MKPTVLIRKFGGIQNAVKTLFPMEWLGQSYETMRLRLPQLPPRDQSAWLLASHHHVNFAQAGSYYFRQGLKKIPYTFRCELRLKSRKVWLWAILTILITMLWQNKLIKLIKCVRQLTNVRYDWLFTASLNFVIIY